jgi:hypothetical protein
LNLRVIIPLENHCNEKLKEDQAHYEKVRGKKEVGKDLSIAADCLLTCIYIVLVSRVPLALRKR